MQIIENSKIKEKIFTEKLSNGITIIVIPKKVQKKYIIWGTNYGSIDNKFSISTDNEITEVPDGIAHYLEHKLFEQENGKNSLDVLSSLGVDANAYTTNNHTAYLYECTDNFFEALDEFMNYIQNPYFTDENVNKERGIIEQEIMMYQDYPEWEIYMNTIKAMYKNNPINIDVAGTKETISKINKENLYKIYNTFYVPNNMCIAVAGDFEPQKIIEEIKNRMTLKQTNFKVKRIYPVEQKEIVEKRIEKNMNISMPILNIGYKDNNFFENIIKKHISIEIILNIIIGKSSNLYKKLYEEGKIFSEISCNYEFSKTFAHLLIQVQTLDVDYVVESIKKEIENLKKEGIKESDFERSKRKIYGELVMEFNDVSMIANGFIVNYFRDINPLDYFEEFDVLSKEYVEEILKEIFIEENCVLSVINPI